MQKISLLLVFVFLNQAHANICQTYADRIRSLDTFQREHKFSFKGERLSLDDLQKKLIDEKEKFILFSAIKNAKESCDDKKAYELSTMLSILGGKNNITTCQETNNQYQLFNKLKAANSQNIAYFIEGFDKSQVKSNIIADYKYDSQSRKIISYTLDESVRYDINNPETIEINSVQFNQAKIDECLDEFNRIRDFNGNYKPGFDASDDICQVEDKKIIFSDNISFNLENKSLSYKGKTYKFNFSYPSSSLNIHPEKPFLMVNAPMTKAQEYLVALSDELEKIDQKVEKQKRTIEDLLKKIKEFEDEDYMRDLAKIQHYNLAMYQLKNCKDEVDTQVNLVGCNIASSLQEIIDLGNFGEDTMKAITHLSFSQNMPSTEEVDKLCKKLANKYKLPVLALESCSLESAGFGRTCRKGFVVNSDNECVADETLQRQMQLNKEKNRQRWRTVGTTLATGAGIGAVGIGLVAGFKAISNIGKPDTVYKNIYREPPINHYYNTTYSYPQYNHSFPMMGGSSGWNPWFYQNQYPMNNNYWGSYNPWDNSAITAPTASQGSQVYSFGF